MASSPRIARHVHAPLQSGSDAALRRMRRKYRSRHYAGRILKARDLMPDAAIGADVMVGFPGETAEEFERSRDFISSMPFTYLHVFTYSARPGTPAADASDQVPMNVRRERNRILRQLAASKNLAFRHRMVGKKLAVVTINPPGSAITDNYLNVDLAQPVPPNRMMEIEIGSVTESGLRELAKAPAGLRVLSTS
jgi:threonylcarbamoyladenosine tRNA methylthiotransferase MtaB